MKSFLKTFNIGQTNLIYGGKVPKCRQVLTRGFCKVFFYGMTLPVPSSLLPSLLELEWETQTEEKGRFINPGLRICMMPLKYAPKNMTPPIPRTASILQTSVKVLKVK